MPSNVLFFQTDLYISSVEKETTQRKQHTWYAVKAALSKVNVCMII